MSTIYSANLERAGTAMIEAAMTAEVKAQTARRQRLDALNRHSNSVMMTGKETAIDDIQDILSEQFESDPTMRPCAFGLTNQERYYELVERDEADKRHAKLEAMELAPHSAADLHARVTALELAIKHPTSDRALKADVAELASILKRLDVAKIFETRIAPLLNVSKRTAERLADEGRAVWANLIKIALARLVDPDKALLYLASLPRLLQLEVAHAAERCREEWAIETEIEKWARKPKLDHGTLDSLPEAQLCRADVRRELSIMSTTDRAKAITTMRREHREANETAEREALAADRKQRKQAFRSDQRFAVAVSNASRVTKAVQSYLGLTPNERADIHIVLGLQAANPNQELAS
jgi:hypothetical protein